MLNYRTKNSRLLHCSNSFRSNLNTQFIKKIGKNELIQFFLCNVIYSGSTFAFNLLFPLIFEKVFFEELVYLFQMVIFMTSMTNLGLTTALLRNHSINKEQSHFYFFNSIFIISVFLGIIAMYPENLISQLIKVDHLNPNNHLVFYFSIIFSNLFLFNRAFMNAEKSFTLMLKSVIIITIIRFTGLISISSFENPSLTWTMAILFVIPFGYELFFFIYHFFRSWICTNSYNFFSKFYYFSLRVFVVAAIFVATDRMVLIHFRSVDPELAAILSFAYGFLGAIAIINFSFSNYFLGKIDPTNLDQITIYQRRIKKTFSLFLMITTGIILVLSGFVYFIYSDLGILAPFVLAILILKTALVSYFGLINVLSKTLNLINYDLLINTGRFILVITILNYSGGWHFLITLSLICSILVAGELILSLLVKHHINKMCSLNN